MPKSTELFFNIKALLDNSGSNIRVRSYSGRGMYGTDCLGIVGSHRECMEAIGIVIKEMHDDVVMETEAAHEEDAECAIADMSPREKACQMDNEFADHLESLMRFDTDSMGRSDIVVYWPNIPWVDEDGEEEEDCE